MTIDMLPLLLASDQPLSPEAVVLLVVASLFLFTTFYLSVVTIPELRGEAEERDDELRKKVKVFDRERHEMNQRWRRLDRDHKALLAKVADPESAANLRRELNHRQIDCHVLRRTKDRLEAERARENCESHDRELELCKQLKNAALDQHVRQRTQRRLEADSACRRARFAEQRSQAEKQICEQAEQIATTRVRLKRSILDLHVKSRLAERLEDATRDQVRQIEELSDQVHTIKSDIRTQSQNAVEQKLAMVEKEADLLRQLKERMHSTDATTTDCLKSLATIGDPNSLRNGHD